MTINALVPNSKGWKLKIDYDVEKIYILQNNDKTVYYDFSILKNALETKHKETLFIKADVKNKTNATITKEMILDKKLPYFTAPHFKSAILLK